MRWFSLYYKRREDAENAISLPAEILSHKKKGIWCFVFIASYKVLMEKIFQKKDDMILIIIEYILAFFVLIDCNSVYANLVNSPYNLQKMSLVFSLILIGVIFWKDKVTWKEILKFSIFPSGVLFLYAILLSLLIKIPDGLYGSYIKYFVFFLPISIFLFRLYRQRSQDYQLFYRIADIVLVLSLVSLFFWLSGSILDIIQPNKVIQSRWGSMAEIDSYWGVQFLRSEQMETIGFLNISIYRNIGLYPESPMFDIALLLALCTELFLKNNARKWRIGILLVTIVSTFGTLAIILAMAALFLKTFERVKTFGKWKWAVFLMICGLIAIVVVLLYNKKLYGTGSYNSHLDDLVACLKAWRTSPLFGTGFENNSIIHEFMADFRKGNKGYTTSAGAILAHGGITLFLIYIIPFLRLLKFESKKMNEALFGMIMLAVFITFVFPYRFLMFWLLAFGFSKIDLKWNDSF